MLNTLGHSPDIRSILLSAVQHASHSNSFDFRRKREKRISITFASLALSLSPRLFNSFLFRVSFARCPLMDPKPLSNAASRKENDLLFHPRPRYLVQINYIKFRKNGVNDGGRVKRELYILIVKSPNSPVNFHNGNETNILISIL